jgi:hypothetical protein
MKIAIGFVLSFLIGAGCRYFDIPAASPPVIPGTILTFFLWRGLRRGCVGNSQVTATSFAIASGAGQYWRARLRAHSTKFEIPQERLGESLIAFRNRCEASDITLVNCDPYVREWMTRQQSGK